MAEERQSPRRRRRRRKRGGGGGAAPEAAQANVSPALPDWRWRTFPVFFAFVVGLLAMALVAGSIIGFGLSWVAVLGVAFGLAHILTRQFIARRRR